MPMFQSTQDIIVLCITDRSDRQETELKAIEPYSATVLTAESCLKGLEIATEILHNVILLDVDLPEVDGFEICRRLKATDDTKDIPVIFLTKAMNAAEKRQAYNLDASGYLADPLLPQELWLHLKSLAHVQNK